MTGIKDIFCCFSETAKIKKVTCEFKIAYSLCRQIKRKTVKFPWS